jgi:hypothetical protein
MNDSTLSPDPGPSDLFWEDELEMPVTALRATAESDDFMTEWLAERNGVQVTMLRHLLGLRSSSSTRSGREDLQGYLPALRRFVPVQRFARHKLKAAVIDFAERQLTPELMALATSGESYDPSALLCAVYDQDWRNLALFYQLEHVFRKGFARMTLSTSVGRPSMSFSKFMSRATLEKMLVDYDRRAGDGRTSQFKSHIPRDGTDLVFIRRPHKPGMLLLKHSIMHGLEPEWIILDFRQAAKRVNICSESNRPSRELAEAIASAYYGQNCAYENERILTSPQQLRGFIDLLQADQAQGLTLAEVRVHNSPLPGGAKLVVSAEGAKSVTPDIDAFDAAFSPLLAELANVEAIKVLFNGKRVS